MQHSSNRHSAHVCSVEGASGCRATHGSQQPEVQQQQQQQQPYVSQSETLTAAQLAPCAITQQDFQAAVKKVQPSVRREGFATTPDVTWSDVGSLAEVCAPSHLVYLAFLKCGLSACLPLYTSVRLSVHACAFAWQ